MGVGLGRWYYLKTFAYGPGQKKKNFIEPDPPPPPKILLGKPEYFSSCMCAFVVFAGGSLVKGK